MSSRLITKPLFWVISVLFLFTLAAIYVFVYSPIWRNYQTLITEKTTLEAELQQAQSYANILNQLRRQEADIDRYHTKAATVLPTEPQVDLLLLKLDALVTRLGLNQVELVVPFGQGLMAVSPAAGQPEPRIGGVGTTTAPVIKGEGAKTTFTVSGEISYQQLNELLVALRNFGRWNRITALDISQTENGVRASVTAEIFFAPTAATRFSGQNDQLLTKASELFDNLTDYDIAPDSNLEGRFGRPNPFLPY